MTNSTHTSANGNDVKQTSDGLPEIAQNKKLNPLHGILIFTALFIVLIVWLTLHHQAHAKNKPAEDESFSVDRNVTLTTPAVFSPPPMVRETNIPVNQAPPPPSQEVIDAQKALIARMQAPIMVISNQINNESAFHFQNPLSHANHAPIDLNTDFLNQAAAQNVDTVQACVLHHRDALIAQGSFIFATLESAINSDLPGMVRAIVSQPVYSEDGSQMLVEPGSRLIGQYKSGMMTGQTRIFVVWTRLIEPNGISILLGSPGTDSLGVAGVAADCIDHHFWQMFGTASLLAIISAGASNIGVNPMDQYNASQAYRQAVSQSFAQAAQNSLQQNMTIPPTLHKNQGDAIIVFVAKDLDFSHAAQHVNNSVEIFS